MENKINTAIIGFGLSGKVFHAPFVQEHKGFHLKTILERHSEKSKEIYPNIIIERKFENILSDASIELVVIALPNIYHFKMAKSCLEAGKHIIVEKPFMPTSAEAQEIILLAKEKNLHVFVYQNRRWDADFLSIKKMIKEGDLGSLKYYESHFDRFSPTRTRAAWRDEVQPGSGILFDLGSHLIDQAYDLFGKPLSIKAKIQSQREGSKVDDFFEINLSYPNVNIMLTAGMLVKNHDLRYQIEGTKGTFIKNGMDVQESALKEGQVPHGKDWGKEPEHQFGEITFNDHQTDKKIVKSEAGDYMAFYQNVFDVIKNNKSKAIEPDEAGDVIRIIELAFESAEKNKEINF